MTGLLYNGNDLNWDRLLLVACDCWIITGLLHNGNDKLGQNACDGL